MWDCFGLLHCPSRQFAKSCNVGHLNRSLKCKALFLQINSELRSLIVYLNRYFKVYFLPRFFKIIIKWLFPMLSYVSGIGLLLMFRCQCSYCVIILLCRFRLALNRFCFASFKFSTLGELQTHHWYLNYDTKLWTFFLEFFG